MDSKDGRRAGKAFVSSEHSLEIRDEGFMMEKIWRGV